MSFSNYLDFVGREQASSPILKQGEELLDLYDLEYENHDEHNLSAFSRKSSTSSVSTEKSSLLSLEQISRQSTISSLYSNTMLVTPPEDSKSVFRQILFEESEDDETHFNYDYWSEVLPTSCHSYFNIPAVEQDVAQDADNEADDNFSPSSFDGVTAMGDSITNCQYSREPIGLGISFEGDASDESVESDHLNYFITLKIHKEAFCETVAERRKRTHMRENKVVKPIKETKPKAAHILIIPRSPSVRQAKLKAMKSLEEQRDNDTPSPSSRRSSKKGKPAHSWESLPVQAPSDYCKYKYDEHRDSYECLNCKTEFKRLEHLKRHSRSIHSDQRPYDCHLCDKSFARSDNLAQHLKVHKKFMDQGKKLPASKNRKSKR